MSKRSKLQIFHLLFLLIITVILTIKILFLSPTSYISILSYVFLLLIFTGLVYLSYFDFKRMEVHNMVSLVLMVSLFLFNVVLFFVLGSENGLLITQGFVYMPYENLLAALILGGVFQLTVLISKERALGLGDVRIAIIVGLLVGFSSVWLWLNVTVFSALAYGLFVAYKKKKFKGLKIPLVPFMVFGIIVVILTQV